MDVSDGQTAEGPGDGERAADARREPKGLRPGLALVIHGGED